MTNIEQFLEMHHFSPYVRRASYSIRGEARRSRERRLLDYQLTYVKEGDLTVYVNQTPHRFVPGDFFLLQPYDLNCSESPGPAVFPFVAFDMFYNPRRAESFVTIQGTTDLEPYAHLLQPRLNDIPGVHIPLKLTPSHYGRFKETFFKLIGLWENFQWHAQLEVHQLAYDLALSILKDHEQPGQRPVPAIPTLQWLAAYMHHHLNEPLSVPEMARMLNMSVSHFSLLFKQHFAVAPHRYLLMKRIEQAKTLLRNTSLSLNEIAEECGFSDTQHLFKIFKKQTGSTPGAYRNNPKTN